MYLLGWIAVALGVIGIFLPLLPTTPFILLAGLLFAKTSPRAHSWLLRQPVIGELLKNWERYGVISTRAKLLSTALMTLMISYPVIYGKFAVELKIAMVCTTIAVALYVCTRPSKATNPSSIKTDPVELDGKRRVA
jgi:uncharacterized membrane protein YbaN (DUF454 family)